MSDIGEKIVMGFVKANDRPNDKDCISQHAQAGLFGAFFSLAGSAAMEFFFSDEELDASKMIEVGAEALGAGMLGYVGSEIISSENSTLFESATVGLTASTVTKTIRELHNSKEKTKLGREASLIEKTSNSSGSKLSAIFKVIF